MITEAMVSEGIRNGSIRFVKDPNSEHGTVCQIGDNWFYFGGETAEEMQPEEYLKAVPIEDAASEVFGMLDDFAWARDEFGDEYAYYEAYLREYAEQSPKMKVERAIEILDPEHRELYDSIEPVNEACRMGMEALKKQIPKALDYEADGYDGTSGELVYDTAVCPSCFRRFELDFDEEAKFCPGCGQALDWSSKPRAKKIAGYVIGMPDTCTLNGNVYVLDDDGNEKMFSTEAKALGFLIAHGYTQRDIASDAVFIEEVKE